jgi:FkbM family methyltransferase
VEVRTLDDILAKTGFAPHGRLDFVTIDTEGTEVDVLKGFSLEQWQPKLVVVENNYADNEIRTHMKSRGYFLTRRHKINDFFVQDG